MKSFKLIRSLTKKADFWPVVVVLFFGWLAARSLFGSGYFNMHDDLQMMRLLEMEKCFLDGQIPCRWVPDMGFGYGFPLFNFYPPLPYLVGMIIRLVGFSFVDSAKGLFIIAFIASGITMYFLAKQFFGKLGGILASVFYIWAPYHSVDIYVRGAMNEAWALIFFPAILLYSYKLITSSSNKLNQNRKDIILLALSWVGLLLSHNLMVMIFTPVFALWCLIWLINKKELQKIPQLIISGVLALGLAAFFTIPVFIEQKLVHADTLVKGYFEYTAHFASINQILFSRFWGYGPSVWMDVDDKMSFQIGHFHWILALVVLILIAYKLLRNRRIKATTRNYMMVALYFIFVGWFAAFMTHSKSQPIWQAFEPLQFVQFPWRFLTLVILGFSLAIGALVKILPKYSRLLAVIILSFGVVIFNFNYFLPENGKLGPLTDTEKFSGAAWDLQRTAGIYDYLPLTAKQNPRDGKETLAEILQGEAQILNPKQGTDWASFDIDVASEQSEVRVNIFDFPNWRVFVDDEEVQINIPEEEEWGRMHINVEQGTHSVYIKLYNTAVRTITNIVSLLTWLGLIGYLFYVSKKSR